MSHYKGLTRLCAFILLASTFMALASGCVNQYEEKNDSGGEVTPAAETEEVRLIATSRAAVAIAEQLDLELVGVPSLEGLPERYDGAARVGSAMGPDMEIIASLHPTEVIGPDTLGDILEAGYAAAGIPATFLNLRSVEGLYESIHYLGGKYGKDELAYELVSEYEKTLEAFYEKRGGQESPTVLVLMGLPGSYIECTQNSYAGSLVALAGGINVVTGEDEDFVSLNTEALLQLDPDYILLTVHALPELVQEMFEEEFSTNDIWRHFRAVQEDKVYYLDYTVFGMSATFDWSKGVDDLFAIFYEDIQ